MAIVCLLYGKGSGTCELGQESSFLHVFAQIEMGFKRVSLRLSVCLSILCVCTLQCPERNDDCAHFFFFFFFFFSCPLYLSSFSFPLPLVQLFFLFFFQQLNCNNPLYISTTILHDLRLLPSLTPHPHQRSRRSLYFSNRFSVQSRFQLIIVFSQPLILLYYKGKK
ncbi:hypothetical protein F5H01DRAFT_210318 [Linnemannia elongata]|nr:hypothetical protein F5H01DRAFT_210318 [Linnemannia elongata]